MDSVKRPDRRAKRAAGLAALAIAGAALFGCDRSPERRSSQPATTVAARPAPAPPWTRSQLASLLQAVEGADREGLRPEDYGRAALQDDVAGGRTGVAVDAVANGAALALAHDYAVGRIRNRRRFNWYIGHDGPDPAALVAQLGEARAQARLGEWLDGMLPVSPDYRALREALARSTGTQRRDSILANLERWRWLPRDGGQGDRLYVNLPTYRLEVIEGDRSVATYRAVIGATDMPTPALSATVRQVIANPDWIVPPSIVRRSHLRPGASSRYIFSTRPDGTLRVRQKPGPGNALGRVKIEFPNPLAIYFHDTPSKALFGASERAFSHGCVRVQNVEALAASIVADPGRLRTALAGTSTRSLRPSRPWRAVIVYLTMVRDGDGGGVTFVGDPYNMDGALAAALEHLPAARKGAVPPKAVTKAPVTPLPSPSATPTPPDDPTGEPRGTEVLPLNVTE